MPVWKLLIGITAMLWFSSASAADAWPIIQMPVLTRHTAPLDASLRALRARIREDAKDCDETARSMDASAVYEVKIRKTIETPEVVGFDVLGSTQCDGAHPGAYEYGIAYTIKDGKRFDLNTVYAVGKKEKGHLFFTKESVASIMQAYKSANSEIPECLDPSMFNDEYLMSMAFTMSVSPDGKLEFYFDPPYVVLACFSSIELDAQAVRPFRDAKKASAYGLP